MLRASIPVSPRIRRIIVQSSLNRDGQTSDNHHLPLPNDVAAVADTTRGWNRSLFQPSEGRERENMHRSLLYGSCQIPQRYAAVEVYLQAFLDVVRAAFHTLTYLVSLVVPRCANYAGFEARGGYVAADALLCPLLARGVKHRHGRELRQSRSQREQLITPYHVPRTEAKSLFESTKPLMKKSSPCGPNEGTKCPAP